MESPLLSPDAEPTLADADVRAVVRLLAEAAGDSGSMNRKRECLMEGLCNLIGAHAWLWAVSPAFAPGEKPVYLYHQLGGFKPEQITPYIMAVEHPDSQALTAPFALELQAAGRHLTRRREQIVSDERLTRSPVFELWVEAGLGPLILSYRPLGEGANSAIGIYRRLEDPPFTPRESKIAHILLSEVDWLHQDGLPVEQSRSLVALSPRCRMVFTQLLHGHPRKKIAENLGLSVHTINDYVKTLFTHFGVRSTPKLIARFRNGDGCDSPNIGE